MEISCCELPERSYQPSQLLLVAMTTNTNCEHKHYTREAHVCLNVYGLMWEFNAMFHLCTLNHARTSRLGWKQAWQQAWPDIICLCVIALQLYVDSNEVSIWCQRVIIATRQTLILLYKHHAMWFAWCGGMDINGNQLNRVRPIWLLFHFLPTHHSFTFCPQRSPAWQHHPKYRRLWCSRLYVYRKRNDNTKRLSLITRLSCLRTWFSGICKM